MSDLRMVDGSLLSSVVKVGMYFSKQKCHNLGGKMFIFWADKKYYCAL